MTRASLPDNKADWLDWASSAGFRAQIPRYVSFGVGDYRRQPDAVRNHVRMQLLGAQSIFVRSSKRGEDGVHTSDHGRYCSCGPVEPTDRNLTDAVHSVVARYGNAMNDDRVVVQEWVDRPNSVLVAHTIGSESDAIYIAVSHSAEPNSAAITGGVVNVDRYVIALHHRLVQVNAQWPSEVIDVIALLRSLESVAKIRLEIEAVQDSFGTLRLLQIRAVPLSICIESQWLVGSATQLDRAYKDAINIFESSRTALSAMSDWNPAELIGIHPKPLTASLFEELVGRTTWYEAREQLGYSPRIRKSLIHLLAGHPYVDVRASCLSLLPVALPQEECDRYAESVVALLARDPSLHDKVESQLYASGLRFDSHNRELLRSADFDEEQQSRWIAALDAHANELIVADHPELCRSSIVSAETQALNAIRGWRQFAGTGVVIAGVRAALIHPFAKVARLAFFANTLLGSARRIGAAIDADECEFQSICARNLASLASLNEGDVYLPAMFDIGDVSVGRRSDFAIPVSANYRFDFRGLDALSESFRRKIPRDHLLRNPVLCARFLRLALEAAVYRELWKNAIGRVLARFFDQFALLGERLNLSRDELAFLTIDELCIDSSGCNGEFERKIAEARDRYSSERYLVLPSVISHASDVLRFREGREQPNFLGRGMVTARVLVVDGGIVDEKIVSEIPHRIVAIASADPGYDWVLRHKPKALVTCYGGPHSHMAMRAACEGVPSLLGCGPVAFSRFSDSRFVRIDFDRRSVETLE